MLLTIFSCTSKKEYKKTTPEWSKNSIMYEVNIRQYTPEGTFNSFSKHLADFTKLNCLVFGISKDSLKKHQNFIKKSSLLVNLLSDDNEKVCESYGVWVEKSMYGRKYMGIERTTFLINGKNKIINIWPKVKVTNHVEEVLEFTKNNLSS